MKQKFAINKIIFSITVFFLLISSLICLPVLAANMLQDQTGAFAGPSGANFVSSNDTVPNDPRIVASLVIRLALSVMGVGMMGYIFYGGYLVLTSAGQEERVTQGKKTIYTAIIGAVLIFGAYSISYFVFRGLEAVEHPERQGTGFWLDVQISDSNLLDVDVQNQDGGEPVTPTCLWIFCN